MSAARVDVTRAARIVVVCGSSGSGKSAWVKQQTRTDPRLIVWDPDDEYEGIRRITGRRALVATLQKATGPARLRYVGPLSDFDYWARCAFAWGNCTAVAEETADVTTPAKAPEGWGMLVRRGRKRGIAIYGVTQRPAESDKTIVGNATLIHVGRLARSQDRAYMAAELDAPRQRLDALQPLEWLERDMATGQITAGKLKFPAPRAKLKA